MNGCCADWNPSLSAALVNTWFQQQLPVTMSVPPTPTLGSCSFPDHLPPFQGQKGTMVFLPRLENVGRLLLPRSQILLKQAFEAGLYSFQALQGKAVSPHHRYGRCLPALFWTLFSLFLPSPPSHCACSSVIIIEAGGANELQTDCKPAAGRLSPH